MMDGSRDAVYDKVLHSGWFGIHSKLQKAIEVAKRVLDRNPTLLGKVEHRYGDKFELVEQMTSAAVLCTRNIFTALGLGGDDGAMAEWATNKSTTLRLEGRSSCAFLRTEEEETTHFKEEEKTRGRRSGKTKTTKAVTVRQRHVWLYHTEFCVVLFRGADPHKKEMRIVLTEHTGEVEIRTNVKDAPYPEELEWKPIEVDASWWVNQSNTAIEINRKSAECRTPVRNKEVERALEWFGAVSDWCSAVFGKILTEFKVQTNLVGEKSTSKVELEVLWREVFIPVVPLMWGEQEGIEHGVIEDVVSGQAAENSGSLVELHQNRVLSPGEVYKLVQEHARAVQEGKQAVSESFPNTGVACSASAGTLFLLNQLTNLCTQYAGSLNLVESVIRQQLVQAIGKEISEVEFRQYVAYHNRFLFRDDCGSNSFCFAVRRPGQCPEGVVSVRYKKPASGPEELVQVFSTGDRACDMSFSLTDAATVRCSGRLVVHGWVNHAFSGKASEQLELCARARQFSGYVLLLGKIGAKNLFLPEEALLLRNKDDVTIPLLLETIPAPKAFKKAIESLSPEQQEFAKAYRSMQLSDTLFALCVVQVKPQLERVLNLPPQALSKELVLTEDLLTLFIKYNIPADILSYNATTDGSDEDWVADDFQQLAVHSEQGKEKAQQQQRPLNDAMRKVEAVRRHVAAVHEMLQKAKQREVDEAVQARKRRRDSSSEDDDNDTTRYKESRKKSRGLIGKKSKISKGKGSSTAVVAYEFEEECCEFNLLAQEQERIETNEKETTKANEKETKTSGKEQRNPVGDRNDVTELPKVLEEAMETHDSSGSLRPAVVKVGEQWQKKTSPSLILPPKDTTLDNAGRLEAKKEAFDLLDALTKSGELLLGDVDMHILLGATHCFDKNLMHTVVEDNVNPVEHIERSSLIMSTTLLRTNPASLVAPAHSGRLKASVPTLFCSSTDVLTYSK